jgi:tRNA threonylcarbamoyladenosine biosynthesis protein TsaB
MVLFIPVAQVPVYDPHPMTWLALATSGPAAEVGLRTAAGWHTTPLISAKSRGRDLLPAVEALLAEADQRIRDLSGVAVDQGPGSFTGVRVGITAAKTLAWALDVPVVGIDSLAILAHAARASGPVVALRDAGRGRVYAGWFGAPDATGLRPATGEAGRVDADELRARSGHGPTAVGEAVDTLLAALGVELPCETPPADAATLMRLALPLLQRGEGVPPHTLVPRYLQLSTPEQRLAGEA